MSLGQRLRRLREERGLTLAQVASAAGLSVSHLSAIENETRRNPSFHIVARLASVYGVPMESLVDEADRPASAARFERERADAEASYLDMARRLAEADALSRSCAPARGAGRLFARAGTVATTNVARRCSSEASGSAGSPIAAQLPQPPGDGRADDDSAQSEGAPSGD